MRQSRLNSNIMSLEEDIEADADFSKSVFAYDSGVVFSIRFAETFRGTFYDGSVDNTGLLIWPEALLLSEYFATRPQWLAGRRMLELGSGTGICGIAAAASLPLASLTMSDREDSALRLIRRNISDNRSALQTRIVRGRPLDWGQNHFGDESLGLPSDAYGLGGPPFDVIAGAGVIYPREDAEVVRLLFRTVDGMLRRPCEGGGACAGGVFLCSYVQRNPATTQWLIECAVELDLCIAHVDVSFLPRQPPMGARLLALCRRLKCNSVENAPLCPQCPASVFARGAVPAAAFPATAEVLFPGFNSGVDYTSTLLFGGRTAAVDPTDAEKWVPPFLNADAIE